MMNRAALKGGPVRNGMILFMRSKLFDGPYFLCGYNNAVSCVITAASLQYHGFAVA